MVADSFQGAANDKLPGKVITYKQFLVLITTQPGCMKPICIKLRVRHVRDCSPYILGGAEWMQCECRTALDHSPGLIVGNKIIRNPSSFWVYGPGCIRIAAGACKKIVLLSICERIDCISCQHFPTSARNAIPCAGRPERCPLICHCQREKDTSASQALSKPHLPNPIPRVLANKKGTLIRQGPLKHQVIAT